MLKQFIEGCRTGNVSVVKACLADSNFDPNELTDSERSQWGRIMTTGFIEASYNGHTEVVSLLLQDSRIDVHKRHRSGWTGFMHAYWNGNRDIVSVLSECKRVDCVCGWKERLDRLCRRLSEKVMRDDHAQWSLSEMWKNLNRIGMGVFIRGWKGGNERMKEVWIYGDREREEENNRSSEMVLKKETEWRRVSDYILEEDITSVLILCHYAERIRIALRYLRNGKGRVSEMESV